MDKIKNLAISDTGFLFDPTTGNTYTLNETALLSLNLLKKNMSKEEILNTIIEQYEVEKDQAERDLTDLFIQLNELGLLS
jgi:PqqD family protein of HPr-rel-A system